MPFRTHPNDSTRLGSHQQALFHEDINGALAGFVSFVGGAKVVGFKLFPDLGTDAAARRILDSLNPERAQNFSQTQLMFLLHWAKEVGYHSLMEYVADETGYTRPSPRAPEDEQAELRRQVIQLGAQMTELLRRVGK